MVKLNEFGEFQELYLVTGQWIIAEVRQHQDKKKIILQDPLEFRQQSKGGQVGLQLKPLIPGAGPGSAIEILKAHVIAPVTPAREKLVEQWHNAAGRPYVQPIRLMPGAEGGA